MFEIKKSKDYRRCNVCNSDTDVKEIYMGTETSGTTIALCPKCRIDLINTIAIEDGRGQLLKPLPDPLPENACRCYGCKRIITDGRIFRSKDDPKSGLCFDCY